MSDRLTESLARFRETLTACIGRHQTVLGQAAGSGAFGTILERIAHDQQAATERRPPDAKIRQALDLVFARGPAVALRVHGEALCWALLEPTGRPAGCFLGEGDLFIDFIDELYGRDHKSPFRLSAWRGLLEAYLRHTPAVGTDIPDKNWMMLREFLGSTYKKLVADPSVGPAWLSVISKNHEILGDAPFCRYLERLGCGDDPTQDLLSLHYALKIPGESWFFRNLVLFIMDGASEFDDRQFLKMVDCVLSLISHNAAVRNGTLRYVLRWVETRAGATYDHKFVHKGLKEHVCKAWGNPFAVREGAWAEVDLSTRIMVKNWIVADAIQCFFGQYQSDNRSDDRRRDFWMRYHSLVNYVHIVTYRRHVIDCDCLVTPESPIYRPHFSEYARVNRRAANALILVIGEYVFIEFGAKGNACYVYRIRDLPFTLKSLDHSSDLKVGDMVVSGTGSDGQGGWVHHKGDLADWEVRFDRAMRGLGIDLDHPDRFWSQFDQDTEATAARLWLGDDHGKGPRRRQRANPQATTAALAFARSHDLKIADERPHNGFLWVDHRYFSLSDDLRRALKNLGFRYQDGRGWWIRNE